MKNLVIRSLCVATLLANCLLPLQAQRSNTDAAIDESVRREALKRDLDAKLTQAADAQRRAAINEAARLYTEALDIAKKVKAGPGAESQYYLSLDGFTQTRLVLAEQAQRAGNYAAADDQFALILREDANNQAVLALRKENDALRVKNAGRRPDDATIARIPVIITNKIDASTLVQNGKVYLEAGRLDEAEANVRKALELDPSNRPASYYLSLITDQRYRDAVQHTQISQKESLLKVEKAWSGPITRESQAAAAFSRTNMVYTCQGRQFINNRLDTIRLNEVSYDSLPLSTVVEQLSRDTKARDPQKRGLNFIISASADPPAAPAPTVDPATGLPVAAAAAVPGAVGDTDLSTFTIKLMPALTDLTLRQALDAIVKVADRPIKYSIEDYAIVFTLRSPESPQLHTRWFKIDPNTFVQGLQGVVSFDFGSGSGAGGGGGGFGGGGGGGRGGGGGAAAAGSAEGRAARAARARRRARRRADGCLPTGRPRRRGQVQQQQPRQPGQPVTPGQGPGIANVTQVTPADLIQSVARQFFTTAGVDFTAPGKQLIFNDRLGMLMVRATLTDLDVIDQAVQVLNMAPPQISLEAKLMEVTQEDIKALGFDWWLGNWTMNNGAIGAQGGSAPSFQGQPDPGGPNPGGVFPNTSPPIPAGPTDGLLSGGLRNFANAPAIATLTGILTDPQFRVVVRALEQRRGVNVMAAPKVTTMSGRQAQVKAVEVRYIVTANDLSQTGGGGTATTVGTATGGGGVGSIVQPIADVFELGPVLDVVPYVSADGFTIQMTIIPTLKQFVGYDLESAALFQAQAQSVGGVGQASAPLQALTPLPIFRLRQVVTSAIVWDGQTVALGGLLADDTTKVKDKVPLLGDLPFFGKLFQSQSTQSTKKNLIIFVTPTIIDPAGNRVHTDEDLPFAMNAIPPQRPVTQP
jgi:type II secretory pathway component GspD/PulD (secretin)/tetratricopeptide (TPR) repeat protein